MELRFPTDVERTHEYQLLEALVGEEKAARYFLRLWVHLGYSAPTTGNVGFMPEETAPLLAKSLGVQAEDLVKVLLGSKWLVVGQGGWNCLRFGMLNTHLKPGFKTQHSKGGHGKAFHSRQRQIRGEVAMQSLLMPADMFRRRDGQALTPEEIQRVMLLVRSLDNALGRVQQRLNHEYTEGMIADAYDLQADLTDDQLNQLVMLVFNHRDHPAMPKTAEQLLPEAKILSEKL
ncbi:MAG TPA: hypothetical protein VGH19_06535 [Verrucomicrobiae bacterium]